MSISISLPDGSVREFDCPITGHELARDIGIGLAKAENMVSKLNTFCLSPIRKC